MNKSPVQTIVMRRVRTIHALKIASGRGSAALTTLGVSLYFIGREVWVARVWQNMPNILDLDSVLRFFMYAFLHTHPVVQVLLLITIFSFVWLMREVGRVVFIKPLKFA